MPVRQDRSNSYIKSIYQPGITSVSISGWVGRYPRFRQSTLLAFPLVLPSASLAQRIDLAAPLNSQVPASSHLSSPSGLVTPRRRLKQKVGESAGSNDLDSSTLLPTIDQWEVYALLFL